MKHPCKIFLAGTSFVMLLMSLTILLRPLPSFKDPLVGFEARDTLITNRLNAWKLLSDETTASANNLSLSANSINYEAPHHTSYNTLNATFKNQSFAKVLPEPPIIEMSTQLGNSNNSTFTDIMDEDEAEYYRSINSTHEYQQNHLMHYSLGSSKAFCGKLYEGYAHVVVAPSTKQQAFGLFNLNSMLAVCQLDRKIRLEHSRKDNIAFQRDCERFQIDEKDASSHLAASTCCNSWSLPNYIACLNNKSSCLNLNSSDMKIAEHLLTLCAPYYFKSPYEECFNSPTNDNDTNIIGNIDTISTSSLNLPASTAQRLDQWPHKSPCGNIPEKCLRCNGWTYTVMNYLTNDKFLRNKEPNVKCFPPKNGNQRCSNVPSANRDSSSLSINKLSYTNIFLPIAKSSSLLNYYNVLSKYNLKTPHAQVKAMDLGLKNSLFESLISDDTKLFIIALISILIVISIYTWSIILSLVILIIICLSLCLSYTIYALVLNIPVFPFMNLLAVVISFGICSDNAMLFCKHWTLTSEEEAIEDENDESRSNLRTSETNGNIKKSVYEEQSNLERILKKSIISTFVATLATSCSFIISAISKVIVVRCFCIFATLSVITNYLLVVLLLPPALILDSRFSKKANDFLSKEQPTIYKLIKRVQSFRLLIYEKIVHVKWISDCVTKYNPYLIITFLSLLACSSILVFYRPTLQPSDNEEIQLFSSKHTFEQYDKNLKKQFAFEREKLGDASKQVKINHLNDSPDTLPIRVVFGLKPVDNGDHLDPQERGKLEFDPSFDLSEPNAQMWLAEFCHRLKSQRFIHPSPGPEVINCFMDTFKSWMEARPCLDPIQREVNRMPCCQESDFPFTESTFNKCIGEAFTIMRKTPQIKPTINAGIRFFKNTTKVAALIIEYQSNRLYTGSFTKMERFFNDVDDWVTWQINNTAPTSLKSGWFISENLELLALQLELEQSTTSSIVYEVLFAMFALMVGTRGIVLTVAGALTIGTIIMITIAALILLEWTLGVAESILISLTIGLSIDFAIHYSVAYSESRKLGSRAGVIHRILDEVGSPIALATTTTSLAGFIIVWSDILAYQELGVFLMLIAFVSWITSTFFLLSLLAALSSIVEYTQSYPRVLLARAVKAVVDTIVVSQ